MKKYILILSFLALSGCSVVEKVKEYWPRPHDAALFEYLVKTKINIEEIDCEVQDWSKSVDNAKFLYNYTEWRGDPQRTNLKGLYNHTVKMNKGGSKVFCELGKNTALQRINATKKAWEGR
jgi:hypothetical protein